MEPVRMKAEIEVMVTGDDLDLILHKALQGGAIKNWATQFRYGLQDYKPISFGGSVQIREVYGTWHTVTSKALLSGIKMYLRESLHLLIDDSRLNIEDLSPTDVDVIMQFAIFGKEKYAWDWRKA